jgi:hypothetical protein
VQFILVRISKDMKTLPLHDALDDFHRIVTTAFIPSVPQKDGEWQTEEAGSGRTTPLKSRKPRKTGVLSLYVFFVK